MSRVLLCALAAVAASAAGGCTDEAASGRYSQSAERAQADVHNEPPYGPGVEAGEIYDYVLYTHCGIEWTRIDGVWWRQSNPIDDGNRTPRGWGDPYDAGELQVLDDDTAVYRSGQDDEVQFERTDMLEPPFVCA